MKSNTLTLLAGLVLCAPACAAQAQGTRLTPESSETTVALVGATLIDVSAAGRSEMDISDAVVVIEGDRILSAGPRAETQIPADARVIDVAGCWILPGLIDGFATLNNQSYADAYLEMGVTSIVAVGGGRRGPIDTTCDPSPGLYRLEGLGDEPMPSVAAVEAEVDRLAAEGYHVVLLMYGLRRDQLRAAHARARSHGMATIGELGFSSYSFGNEVGLDAFVHTTRYSLDAAPHYLTEGVAHEPFSNDLESDKWKYYHWLSTTDLDQEAVHEHARRIGRGPAAIMPTLSLLYLDLAQHENPWTFPVAEFLDAADVNAPADPATGRHVYDDDHATAYARLAERMLQWERRYRAAGARYLAGSATDVWGTMPGISLHTELELLTRVGLAPREVLAAATSNTAETLHLDGLGAVSAGKQADILVVASNPLEDVRSLRDIRLVVADGDLLQPPPRSALVGRRALPAEGSSASFEELTYRSDGHIVRGYVALPAGPGPHPLIVRLRGGNRSFGAWSDERAIRSLTPLTEWGYAVIAPQFRGSDDPEEGASLDEFGGADVNDIFSMIDLMSEFPVVDTSRMGIEGWSRGGMMACLALRRTPRFRAAIVVGGLSDLERMAADRPVMLEVFGDLFGTEDEAEFTRRMRERSAVTWADELPASTPILLMHGSADWRVQPEQSYDLARGLQAGGVPYRLTIFEGGDHSLTEHRPESNRARREWLDRFVRDGEPLPDLKPHGR